MGKVLGKLLQYSFNGTPLPLVSNNYDESFDVIDVTDNGTSGDGKETVVSRATRTITVEGILKPSTTKLVGKDMNFTFNSVSYKLTDASFEETYDEVDLTDSGTTGDGTEFDVGRADRKLTLDLYMLDSQANIIRGTEQAATLAFAAGSDVAGSFRPESLKITGAIKDAVKVNIAGSFQGAPTQTGLGLTAGTSGAFIITYADGTTTDKAISGTAVLMSKKVTANVKGEVKVSYTFKVSGGITETVKA